MDINSEINVLGGIPDMNIIRVFINGETQDKTTNEIQQQYMQIPLKQHADSDRTACCSASSGTE